MRVEALGLGKRFGDVVALRDVCFEIPAGRRVGLVGPNGSGKSTLNRALMGLLRCDGEVRLDGRPLEAERVALARRMAYVPQTAPALAVPVRELLRAVCELRELSPSAVAKVAARFDLDLEAVAAQPFRALSGGTRQKLLIALALGADASLLILDEPTGSLDARSRETFFSLIGELAGERTVVLCSHRLEEVRQLVDHVLMLEDGSLVWDGSAADFLSASARSRVEVRIVNGAPPAWLAERGFARGTGGWWVRHLSHAEKLELLPQLTAMLGSQLEDLLVRDLESLEIAGDAEDVGER